METDFFFVGDRAQAFWDWDLKDRNLEFLQGLDPDYCVFIAQQMAPLLDDPDTCQEAAAALRVAYGQGIETLMALVAAALQAPTCPLGWMLSYQTAELRTFIERIRRPSGSPLVYPMFRWPYLDGLADEVLAPVPYPDPKGKWVVEGFTRFWYQASGDFVDPDQTAEYNAIKHGTRLTLGGSYWAIGRESIVGEAAPEMHSMGGSEFGSSIFTKEKVAGDSVHWRPRRRLRNWAPETWVHDLQLVSMSLRNLISFLKTVSGVDPTTCQYQNPESPDLFERQATGIGFLGSSFDTRVSASDIRRLSKADVEAAIRRHWAMQTERIQRAVSGESAKESP